MEDDGSGGRTSTSEHRGHRGTHTNNHTERAETSDIPPSWMDADLPDWIDEFTPPPYAPPGATSRSGNVASPGGGNSNEYQSKKQKQKPTSCDYLSGDIRRQPRSAFETLLATNPHASNALLVNLTVPAIANFALVCKAARRMTKEDGLWRAKFVMRWSIHPAPVWTVREGSIEQDPHDDSSGSKNEDNGRVGGDDSDLMKGAGSYATEKAKSAQNKVMSADGLTDSDSLWFRAYQNAHRNLHDLWLTHWNCTLPSDGTSAGRCAVPDLRLVPDALLPSEGTVFVSSSSSAQSSSGSRCSSKEDGGYDSPLMRKCPTCRHHPLINSGLAEINDALDAELKFAERISNGKGLTGDHDPVTKSRANAEAHALLLRRDLGPWEQSLDEEELSRFKVATTPAKAIFRSSLYSAAKWARNLREKDNLNLSMRSNPNWDARPMDSFAGNGNGGVVLVEPALTSTDSATCPKLASMVRQRSMSLSAFKAAATCHRRINPAQYRSSGLQFMTDALFFNVDPAHGKVRDDTGWIGSISCPVGRNRPNNKAHRVSGHNQLRPEDPGDEHDMPVLEKAMRDVYGDAAIDLSAASVPSDPTPPSLEPNAPGTLSSRGHKYDSAFHTWHVARLSNPDFVRPITFRVYVQRPDCFTAFPASGYLRPGESCEIVLGVRALGSVIAEACESIDCGREEIDPLLAEIYAREAHLPYAPFAIRYMFAPAPPCIPPGYMAREDKVSSFASVQSPIRTQTSSSLSSNSSAIDGKSIVDNLWDSVACETDVRTIYVSAHVNANYGFDEFMNRTLLPFELKPRQTSHEPAAPTFLCPFLKHLSPNLYQRLDDIGLELEKSALGGIYRSEKACLCCGRAWGAKSEELARVFLLTRMAVDRRARLRSRQVTNAMNYARLLPSLVHRFLLNNERAEGAGRCDDLSCLIHRIGFGLNSIFLLQRANKMPTALQRAVVTKYEVFLNDLLLFIQENSSNRLSQVASDLNGAGGRLKNLSVHSLPRQWRNVGVYRFLRCTDSVYNLSNEVYIPGKSEPGYLETFRNLWHSPGFYRLGAQDDPNHMSEHEILGKAVCGSRPKRLQRINWRHADVFKQDASMALACAMSMIHSPRSLLLHGVYDRLDPLGTICHRAAPWDFQRIFSGPNENAYTCHQVCSLAHQCIQDFERSVERQSRFALFGKPSQHPRTLLNGDRILVHSSHEILKSRTILGWKSVSIDINDVDPKGIASLVGGLITYVSSQEQFICNVPGAGCGRFSLSDAKALPHAHQNEMRLGPGALFLPFENVRVGPRRLFYTPDEIVAVNSVLWNARVGSNPALTGNQRQRHSDRLQVEAAADNPAGQEEVDVGGPRIINLLWLISSHLGWSVDDDRRPGAYHVERGILIATQYLSNTLMLLPLFLTLVARHLMFITPSPLEYHLEGLPYVEVKRMRYLGTDECGWATLVVVLLYLVLGRFSERNVCRSFNRAMLEVVPDPMHDDEKSPFKKFCSLALLRWQRIYDSITPLFIQSKTFSPRWNRRSRHEVENFIIQARSCDNREHQHSFSATSGLGRGTIDIKSLRLEGTLQPNISFLSKVSIGFLVSVGSFCACSPHFSLNLITTFYSSIALGLSMSLQYMEQGNGSVKPRRIFKPMRLNVVIITSFLFGQLVGSSGGILFLAEFVVTTISLLLGGAATISTNAVESWMTFFFLSATSFVGYLFARVALVDNTRNKRGGVPSFLLLLSLVALSCLTVCTFLFLEFEIPPTALMIRAPLISFVSPSISRMVY